MLVFHKAACRAIKIMLKSSAFLFRNSLYCDHFWEVGWICLVFEFFMLLYHYPVVHIFRCDWISVGRTCVNLFSYLHPLEKPSCGFLENQGTFVLIKIRWVGRANFRWLCMCSVRYKCWICWGLLGQWLLQEGWGKY